MSMFHLEREFRRLAAFGAILSASLTGGWVVKGGWDLWPQPQGVPASRADFPVVEPEKSPPKVISLLWRGYLCQLDRNFDQAEYWYRRVIQETWDQEEIALAHQMLLQLQEARSLPSGQAQRRAPGPSAEPKAAPPVSPAVTASAKAAPQVPPRQPVLFTIFQKSSQVFEKVAWESSAHSPWAASSWLETSLPTFVEVSAGRLAATMDAAGETDLTRLFTEEEFAHYIVESVQKRFSRQMEKIDTHIEPDGVTGSAQILWGTQRIHLFSKVGLTLRDNRPHVVIREIRVEGVEVPAPLKSLIEAHVNGSIDRRRYPIKFKRLDFRKGSIVMTVERLGPP